MPVSRAALWKGAKDRVIVQSAIAMAYGWGWRGSYGHEAGAMFPGALLGIAICLASGRPDWRKRAAVAGLFGAIGWSWGGAMSYMEHTFYVKSDSFPDTVYGFACLALVGALWSGTGAGILSLALTRPRSEIEGYLRALAPVGFVGGAIFMVFYFVPEWPKAIDQWGERRFHDAEFFSATVILLVSGANGLLSRPDRPYAWLLARGAAAWWVGYLVMTKWGGLLLAPPNRSEGWGGSVGVLLIVLHHLLRQKNRAGLLLTAYGMLAGGIGFSTAVFLPQAFDAEWPPVAWIPLKGNWKWSEELFGLFMGFGVAWGAAALLRKGIAPPEEDAPARRSDLWSAWFLLVPMMWLNLQNNVSEWEFRYQVLPEELVGGMLARNWWIVVGLFYAAMLTWLVAQHGKGRLATLLPSSASAKGVMLFLIMLWAGHAGVAMHRFAEWKRGDAILVEASYWLLCGLATWLAIRAVMRPDIATEPNARSAGDPDFRPSRRFWLIAAASPLLFLLQASFCVAIRGEPGDRGRKRFGPDAYWRMHPPD